MKPPSGPWRGHAETGLLEEGHAQLVAMNPEGEIWPVVLVAASVVMLWVILSVTSSGTFDVVGAG